MSEQIEFKQSTTQFIKGWQADTALQSMERIVVWVGGIASVAVAAMYLLLSFNVGQWPVGNLFAGAWFTRLLWLVLLLDVPALYLRSEAARRKVYTSKDDVFDFLDSGSRNVLAQMILGAKQQGVRLDSYLALRLMISTGYFQGLLHRLEVNVDQIQSGVAELGSASAPVSNADEVLEERFKQYLQMSAAEAMRRGDQSFGLADIFQTLLQQEQPIQRYFATVGITPEQFQVVTGWLSNRDHVRAEYHHLRDERIHTGPVNRAWTSVPTPALNRYSTDMTIAAASGNAPLVTVRADQVEEVMRILSRATKNNVLLVGEPGVGKSAIVERIALSMLGQDAPPALQDRRLVQLDAAALHSDSGGFAAAFEAVVVEAERAGNVILFIPELQDLSTEQQSGLAAAQLLLPILERGRMQVIGATTLTDYHQNIEHLSSFANAFSVVEVPEVSEAQAITVLEEVGLELEARHHVTISLKATEAAVHLSAQYIHDRVLPEKAIDVLDEAAVLATRASRKEVTEADVRQVLSVQAQVPVSDVQSDEQSLLLNLETALHARVVGQDEAVKAVAEALRRARAGLQDSNRPIGVFLFVGPTGVGKTELAKALSDIYFHRQDSMVRLDMSEFQEVDAIDKLLGKGSAEGLLTSPVRTHPFSLVLLDEFEKASAEVRNVFLQIFDDGRATDGAGHVVDFKNAIIIATSNAGSLEIQQAVTQAKPYPEIVQMLQNSILPQLFRPELLNRFDGVIVFRNLTEPQIVQIARLQLQAVAQRVEQHSGVKVSFTDAVVAKLGELGFDPTYGGRPLRRVIQEKVEGPLAQKLLQGQLQRGQVINFDVGDLA